MVMPNYRHPFTILVDILKATAFEPLLLTHVMYKANVNVSALKPKLEYLIDLGMLEKDGKKYRTTAKGHEVLKKYRQLRELFGQHPWD